jgi:fatty-acyl-CoA synthase
LSIVIRDARMSQLVVPPRGPMAGLMMPQQFNLWRLVEYAGTFHPRIEVVAQALEGPCERSDWAGVLGRSRRLAAGLVRFGVDPNWRIASLAWNTLDHLLLHYAVTGLGVPLHTLNPRLTAGDLAYMAALVEDDVCCFDAGTADLARDLAALDTPIRCWIFMGEGEPDHAAAFPGLVYLRDIAAADDTGFAWPDFDENRAAVICFTSGTTGRPKGVAYSHRSLTLTAMAMTMAEMYGGQIEGEPTCVLPIAAMFHSNAWLMPFSAPMNGHKLVLPGRRLDGANVVDLVLAEGVTMAAGVPTVWNDVIRELDRRGISQTTLNTALVSGTRMPPTTAAALVAHGIRPRQSWGMTECPGTARGAMPWGAAALTPEAQAEFTVGKQGRIGFHARARIVDEDGTVLPHDGATPGNLEVSGPTVLSRYLGEPESAAREWLETGDIARIYPDSSVEIVDRAKDVIKSGGEWISSPELEAAALAHPAIRAAAAIAMPHPRWQERPLLVCVLEDGAKPPSDDELREFMAGFVARWWLPDAFRYVAALPMTTTGKINKAGLRAQISSESEAAGASE